MSRKPTVFISYSWDNDAHKDWVFDLAAKLQNAGIDVKLDRDGAQPGTQIPDWMERAIVESDFVILVCTPGYRDRWYRNIGGVGYEGTVIKGQLLAPNGITRFIPILRGGAWRDAAPPYFYGAIYLDLTNDLPSELESLIDFLHGRKTLNLPDRDALPLGNLWMLPVLPTRFFTGQVGKVNEIREAFNEAKPLGITPVEGLTGEGGIGKTELALQYCRAHQSEYREILWLNGNNRASLQADLTRAYEGILGTDDGLDGQPGAGLQRALMMIRYLQSQTGWLVVLDNVDTPDALREEDKRASEEAKQDVALFEPILKLRNGHVLITTRQDFWGDLAQTIRLDVLSGEEGALLFLKRCLNRAAATSLDEFTSDEQQAALEFSREVGGFQLALEQGGATARTYSWTPARYLKEFQSRFEEMIKKRGKGVDRHEDAVYATVLTSVEEIEKVEPRAREFITWCAYLPSDWIIEEIFQVEEGPVYESIKEVPLEDLIFAVRGQSVIHKADNEVFTMHRLIQRIVRDIDSGSGAGNPDRYEALAVATNVADPGRKFEHWKAIERLIPVWRHLGEHGPDTKAVILGLNKASFHGLSSGGGLSALVDSQSAISKAKRSLGYHHSDTLAAMSNLAATYSALGRHQDALLVKEEVLRANRKILGEGHLATLTSMNNLASTYLALGRHQDALYMQEGVLAARREILGQHHPDSLAAMTNLASIYWALGRLDDALLVQEEVVAPSRKILGERHPDTLKSMNNLATIYLSLGRHWDALHIQEEVLEARREILGVRHPDTLMAMSNLASTYSALGRHEDALHIQEEVLKAHRDVLGERHPDTFTGMNNLAYTYSVLGRYEAAISLERQAFAGFAEMLGRNHPNTQIVREWFIIMLTARPDLALPGELESLKNDS